MLRSRTKPARFTFRLGEVPAAKARQLANSWDMTISALLRLLIDSELARLHDIETRVSQARRYNDAI